MLNNYNKVVLILVGVLVSASAYALIYGNFYEGLLGIIVSVCMGVVHWNGD